MSEGGSRKAAGNRGPEVGKRYLKKVGLGNDRRSAYSRGESESFVEVENEIKKRREREDLQKYRGGDGGGSALSWEPRGLERQHATAFQFAWKKKTRGGKEAGGLCLAAKNNKFE